MPTLLSESVVSIEFADLARRRQFPHRNRVEDLLFVRVESIQRAYRNARLLGHPAGGDLLERNMPEQSRRGETQ